jgi:2'-hydroxyisoflavone reductase
MKILVLGGTQFVGRHIVEELLRGGHTVSLFNRGMTRDELPGDVERLRGDRDEGPAGITSLAGREWDACIDVSGLTPTHVRASAEVLHRSVARYVHISAISVYGNPAQGPVDESQPRVPPADESINEVNAETYGPLKVTCENIVQEFFDGRCALLRPQIVAGPYDPFDRFSYWVRRATQGGEMLAPGDGSDYLQTIDAGDLARFTGRVCEAGLAGSFNLAGSRITWTEFMQILPANHIVWVPKEIIAAAGVTEFELPLYRPAGGRRSSLMHVSNDRAVAAGLTISDPRTTIANVQAWLCKCELAPALSPEREAALIQASRGRVV